MAYSKENNKNILAGHNFKINIDDFSNKDYICGHYGLTPIPYSEKTFTVLRDPVERSFSYMKYIWIYQYNFMSMDEAFNFFLKKENLREVLSNQQSKFLTQNANLDEYNKNVNNVYQQVLSGWYLINKDIDMDSVINSVINNKIQVLFFDEPELYKKVFNIFKLTNIEKFDFSIKANESPKADTEVYKKWYDELHKINELDIKVYNFFKKGNKDDIR
jgi:hypothetical protein